MKVVYIAASLPFSNAGDDFFIPEAVELLKAGVELRFVPRDLGSGTVDPDAAPLLQNTCRIPLFSPGVVAGLLLEVLTRPAGVLRTLALLPGSGGTQNLLANIAVFPKAVWVARMARSWGAEHLHAQWASTTASMALFASELSGVPFSFTAHRADIVLQNLFRAKAEKAAFVRFISKSGLALAVDLCKGLAGERLKVIHMGVSIPQDTAPRAHGRPPVILCPANMIPLKGHLQLLESVLALKRKGIQCRLLLAGRGVESRDGTEPPFDVRSASATADPNFAETAEAVIDRVKSNGLEETVGFLGQVPHHRLMGMYSGGMVDCVVLPSLDLGGGLHEGIPVSLMEAMAHGIPVISTRTGGIPELLDGGAGVIMEQTGADAMAAALEKVLTDADEWSRLSKAGRERVEKDFSAVGSAGAIAALFEESTKGRK